jgi:hypothetical protein
MAAAKDIHFFSRDFHKGVFWYKSHFVGGTNVPIVGEFSTSYMLDTAVPERIASLLPKAKLLFIFRNPIERAYSNYWFSISIGTQDREQSFSDAIRTSIGYKKYIESGFYYYHLSRFMHYFPIEQFHVMITEEFKRFPIQQMGLCYAYLGIDSIFQPDVNQQYNVTVTTKNKWLGTAYTTWVKTKQQIKPIFKRFPAGLRRTLARFEKRTLKQMISDERPTILDADRAFLADVFSEQNKKLTELIGRELPYWH